MPQAPEAISAQLPSQGLALVRISCLTCAPPILELLKTTRARTLCSVAHLPRHKRLTTASYLQVRFGPELETRATPPTRSSAEHRAQRLGRLGAFLPLGELAELDASKSWQPLRHGRWANAAEAQLSEDVRQKSMSCLLRSSQKLSRPGAQAPQKVFRA